MGKDRQTTTKRYQNLYKYSQRYLPHKILTSLGLKNTDRIKIEEFVLTYIYPFLFGAIIFLVLLVEKNLFDNPTLFMFFFIAVTLSTALGSFKSGLITIVLGIVESFYFFNFLPPFILRLALFIFVSLLISYIIDLAKKSNEISKLRAKEREYAKTFIKLDEQYQKAQEEIRARDEFLSIASHELKTPLTTMLLKLNRMLNNVRNVSLSQFSIPELMRVLENAELQVKKLSQMINDLLNLSLITTGRLDLDLEEVNLVKITKNVTENFSELIKQEKYKVRVEAEKPVIGNWDKTKIEQAITNLVSNALKYGQNKPIDIQVLNSGHLGKLIIHDQGIGISRSEQTILFDRFKRAVSSKEYNKGLGVGLYITNQIVKAHKGSIRVSSTPGKGSTFILELPLKSQTTKA